MYRRPFKSVAFVSLLCLFLVSPALISGTHNEPVDNSLADCAGLSPATAAATFPKTPSELLTSEADALYDSMRLKRFGLTRTAFEYAWKGYKILLEKGKLGRDQVLSICDFSQSSKRKRLYIIDIEQRKMLLNTYVAHGRNSGGEYARSFSNNPESHKSSLGFYITRHTYYGEHGLALKIDGVEQGINDNANERNIVVHGSQYVGQNFLRSNKFNGRSYGCPAVPAKETQKVIKTIQDGSCLFIYHPTKYYLTKSRILNG
ncbi:MAG: murein L,D-transpeptidase catalytic domain family protein [Chitinophagaceae bacterium]